MRKITLDDLLKIDNFYIHWSNVLPEVIEKNKGLKASIGSNSKLGSETTPKVFFAKGIEGEIGILNRYLNLIYNKQENKNDLKKVYQIFEEIINTNIKSIYMLDLKHTDKKTYELLSNEEKSQIDFLDDDINEENGQIMTTRNMHAIVGKNIDLSKLSLIDIKMTNLIERFYKEYKNKEKNNTLEVDYLNDGFSLDLISGFVEYLNEKKINIDSKSDKTEKNAFEDCMQDDKVTMSTMQITTKAFKNTVLDKANNYKEEERI